MLKLTVLIPVYKGGAWFKECLESLVLHKKHIGSVVVSFNKSEMQREDIKIFEIFQKNNNDIQCVKIVQTISCSAAWHGRLIWWRLRHYMGESHWMVLAHDDVLLPSFSDSLKKLESGINGSVAVNPSRSYYDDAIKPENFIFSYFGLKAYESGISVNDFISLDFSCHYITNISGVILPRKSLRHAWRLTSLLKHGYRAEYLYLTAYGVEKILGTDAPVIGIRVHRGQEGSCNYKFSRCWDEKIYLVHLLFRTNDKLIKRKILRQSRILRLIFSPREVALKAFKKICKKLK